MLQHDFAPSDSVCLFFGQSDTHAPTFRDRKTGVEKINSHPSAGQPYGSIDEKGIVVLLSAPAAKPKESASAIIPSRLISPLARNHALQHSAGRFIWSCYDIDKGNRSLDDVRSNFEAVFPGTTKLIYSSSSATADDKRWRVLMPMLEVSGEDFQKIQKAAFALIEQNGLQLDEALARCGQPVYLPNVPPSKRDQDGKPFFYQHALIQAAKLDATSHAGIQACIHRADQREKAMRKEANAQRLGIERKRAERTKQYGQNQSPIDHFNETHPLEDLMLEYGYKHLGGPHYASPNSKSKGSAVRVWDGKRWSSLTSGDAEIGQKGDVGTWGDAFDLFVHYEHQGDQTAALKAYALAAGLSSGPKMDNDFSDFEFVNSDRGFEDAGEEKTANGQNEAKSHHASGFPLIRVGDMTFSAPQFVVYGLLETSSLSLAFGEPGCGKSFIAIDLACCIASGLAFHGREVKGGPVIYLAGEGHSGIKRRTIAWERHNGQSLQNSPLYFSRVPARLLDADHAKSVARAVDDVAAKEGIPVLIVIDTLARSFAGGDENSTKDMNDFVAAVDDMKARYSGCTVLIIHHSGHSDKQRARGAGSLKGALDAEYMVKRQGDIVSVTSPKMKDAPEIEPLAFKLKSIDVGVTEDGEVFTSAVLEETQAQRQQARVLTGNNKLAMDTFLRAKANRVGATDPSVAVHLEDWRSEFYAAHTGDNQNSKKTMFNRARGELVSKGFLSVLNDFYRLAGVSDGNS